MRTRLIIRWALVILTLLSLGLCSVDAQQRRRRRSSRRITNPVIYAPKTQTDTTTTSSTDAQIVSNADETASNQNGEQTTSATTTKKVARTRTAQADDPETMRRSVNKLSDQVTQLSDKLSRMEGEQRTLVDLERLSRAEQRAEGLRAQLRDVLEKSGNLEARAEQLDFDLKPENIERSVAAFGTTHPEEARDQRRRQLESEKNRVRAQIQTLATSRTRLELAIQNADAEADRIRERLDAATTNPEQGDKSNGNTTAPEIIVQPSTPPPVTTPEKPPLL